MIEKTGIALNWQAFSDTATGAARRAFELHRRMPDNLRFTAFVNSGISGLWHAGLPGFRFVETGGARTPLSRLTEGSGCRWRRMLRQHGCGLWVTDTLPVIRTGDGASCITVHDLRYLEDRKYVRLRRYLLMKFTMARSLARADAIIAVSEYGAQLIDRFFPFTSGKVHVIPNAVERNFTGSAANSPPPFRDPYILCVGHLEKRKNNEMLVRAFAGVSSRWEGLLVIAGKDQGTKSDLLNAAVEKGIEDRVIFAGPVSEEELRTLFRHCEAVVCPSLYEGFGITALEGMAAGKPVIASAIPPHVEITGDAALLVDTSGDMEKGLEKAVLRVLSDPEFASELGRKGSNRAENYSWDESARKLESLYRWLIDL